jgi:hypothetical protein
MFFSFNLQKLLDHHHGKNVDNRHSISLIVNILKKLEKLDSSLYEASVLAVFSRLVYFSILRTSFAEVFLDRIPRLPSSCVSLLIILLHSGQKQQLQQQSHSKGEVSSKASVRSDCLHLLAQCVRLNKDEASSLLILNYLLSCCLSDDFEIRSKVIGCVVSHIYDASKQSAEDEQSTRNRFLSIIRAFAVQSLFFSFSSSISSQLFTDYIQSCSHLEDLSSDYSFFSFLSECPSGTVPTLQESFSGFFHGSLSDNLRKSFHLIEQLALVDTQFLSSLAELYCFCSYLQNNLSGKDVFFLLYLSLFLSPFLSPVVSTEIAAVNDVILGEMKIIIPAVNLHFNEVDILEAVLSIKSERLYPLIEYVLNLLTSDVAVPPKPLLLESVGNFISCLKNQPFVVYNLSDEDFRICLPLIASFSTEQVEILLPRILKLCADKPENLKLCFSKLYKSRPPVIAKVSLLVLLHR